MKLIKLLTYTGGALVMFWSSLPARAQTFEDELLRTKFRAATPYSFGIVHIPGHLHPYQHSRNLPYESAFLGKRKNDELNVVFLAMKMLKEQHQHYSFDQDPIENDRPLSSGPIE